MASPAGSNGPAAVASLPTDREQLLEHILPERQKLYRLVRRVVDELDEAAPWEQLYYPPDDDTAFLGMTTGLLGVVDGIPDRTHELVALLSLVAPDDETRQTLEDAEFYFAGIHSMCSHDTNRLRKLLDEGGSSRSDRIFACEVAADLKGKYTSALMGAASSIVAEGNYSGVEVEALLFPEKGEEARRNEGLAAALARTVEAIGELAREVPFADLLARWRANERVDPYALADLATFRGVLGHMLKRDLRRALYSGDYHQIQRREVALAVRIAQLESIHHETWLRPADAKEAREAYRTLRRLTLEIAAILDVELLEEIAGSKAVSSVRMAVTSDQSKVNRSKLEPELEALVPLLAGEDLKSFLSLLLGSVLKRASLANRTKARATSRAALDDTAAMSPMAVPRPLAAPELAAGLGLDVLPAIPDLDAPREVSAEVSAEVPAEVPAAPAPSILRAVPAAPSPPPPMPVAPAPAALQRAPAPVPVASPEKRREVVESLHDLLTTLQSPTNPQWSSYRMLQRLLERHSSVPPSIVQGAHPFVYEVLNELVPQLEVAASLDAVPPEARRRLVECCLAITDDQITPGQMAEEMPANLSRLTRLLEALTAATTAQLR